MLVNSNCFKWTIDSANSYCLIQPLVKENDETRLRTKKHAQMSKRIELQTKKHAQMSKRK